MVPNDIDVLRLRISPCVGMGTGTPTVAREPDRLVRPQAHAEWAGPLHQGASHLGVCRSHVLEFGNSVDDLVHEINGTHPTTGDARSSYR